MAGTDVNKGNGVRKKPIRRPFKRACKRCSNIFIKKGKFNWVCPKCQKIAYLKAIVNRQKHNRLRLPIIPTNLELREVEEWIGKNKEILQ